MNSKAKTAREAVRKTRKFKGVAEIKARRTFSPSQKSKVVVGDEAEEVRKRRAAEAKKKKDEEQYTIMRYLGKPKERMKARARELEVIDVAPKETITFGSTRALEAYRRDLYQVNGQKTSHFRTSRRGLTLTIWRDE